MIKILIDKCNKILTTIITKKTSKAMITSITNNINENNKYTIEMMKTLYNNTKDNPTISFFNHRDLCTTD